MKIRGISGNKPPFSGVGVVSPVHSMQTEEEAGAPLSHRETTQGLANSIARTSTTMTIVTGETLANTPTFAASVACPTHQANVEINKSKFTKGNSPVRQRKTTSIPTPLPAHWEVASVWHAPTLPPAADAGPLSPLFEEMGARSRCANPPTARGACSPFVPGSGRGPPKSSYLLTKSFLKYSEQEPGNSEKTEKSTLANSPINIKNLKQGLKEYPNSIHADILLQGFTHGFKLGFTGIRSPQMSKNLSSVASNIGEVRRKIDKEVSKGRVAGPFDSPPLKNFKMSPIGIVPKKALGEFRLIHHLSWPVGNSVIDNIDPAVCSVKYSSFDDAISIIQQAGKNCEMARKHQDIANHFWRLSIMSAIT